MHDAAYARAARPALRRILRLPMLHYSIGHEIILQSQGNPLVTLTEAEFNELTITLQIDAIRRAALVCHHTWAGNSQPERWLGLWSWTIRNTDWPLEIAEFRIYRAEGSTAPPITAPEFSDTPVDEDAPKGRSIGSPLLARLVNFLAARPSTLNPQPSTNLMDYPLGAALFEYFASMEEQGRIHIENAGEQETRESFEANKAAILAEQCETTPSAQPTPMPCPH